MQNSLDYLQLNLEGMVASAGLSGELEWCVGEHQLKASIWMPFDEFAEDSLRLAIDSFLARLQSSKEARGVTITSFSDTVETGITFILQLDTDVSLDQSAKFGTLDELVKQLASSFEYQLRKRRPKRSKDELPDPEKPAKSYANAEPLRTTFQLGARVSKETIDEIAEISTTHEKTKRQIIEEAVKLYKEHLDDPQDGPT